MKQHTFEPSDLVDWCAHGAYTNESGQIVDGCTESLNHPDHTPEPEKQQEVNREGAKIDPKWIHLYSIPPYTCTEYKASKVKQLIEELTAAKQEVERLTVENDTMKEMLVGEDKLLDSIATLKARVEELEQALKDVIALFREPSPFYIQKLGAPITNGDQAVIDKAFIAADAAILAKHEKGSSQ